MIFGFVFGFLAGLMLDVIWSKKLNNTMDKAHVIEHYHWGLVLLTIEMVIFTEYFLSGLASSLFVSEWTFDKIHPFAYGKRHFTESSVIGVILLIISISVWILMIL